MCKLAKGDIMKPKAAKPKGEAISIETPQGRAKLATIPEVNAAAIVQVMNSTGEPDLQVLIDELAKHSGEVSEGDMTDMERMLVSQAHALDSMFSSLVRRAKVQENLATYEAHMRFALRAQSQCRATLETLATIKNPPIVYAKQANIAHGHQQVNNGVAAPVAREQTDNRPTELLDNAHESQWLDTGKATAAGTGNPPLATLETIDRAAHAGRQGRVKP